MKPTLPKKIVLRDNNMLIFESQLLIFLLLNAWELVIQSRVETENWIKPEQQLALSRLFILDVLIRNFQCLLRVSACALFSLIRHQLVMPEAEFSLPKIFLKGKKGEREEIFPLFKVHHDATYCCCHCRCS
jgi:hypothetical protein